MKATLQTILIASVLGLFTSTCFAHGDDNALHGGTVKVEHDVTFELVTTDATTELYIRDHGEAVDATKLSGTLTTLLKGKKTETKLVASSSEKLTADIKIESGAIVLVKVKIGDHHPITVRYKF